MKITPEYQRLLDRRKERHEQLVLRLWVQKEKELLEMRIKSWDRGPSLLERLRSWWPRKQDKADEPQRRTA